MYSGKAGGSLFTEARGKKTTTFCTFNQLRSVSSIIPRKHGGLCLQERGFCFSKQAPYLSSLHHFLPLTSKVNDRNTELKLGFTEPLTFGACLLLLRHHKMKEVVH